MQRAGAGDRVNVPIEVASWSVFGLAGLVLLAGALLAWRHRGAHRTTALLAVVGLLCVLADYLLGVGIAQFYPRLPPGERPSDYWQAQQLGQQSLHHVANLTGAVGWALVIAAVFAETKPPQPVGRTQDGALR